MTKKPMNIEKILELTPQEQGVLLVLLSFQKNIVARLQSAQQELQANNADVSTYVAGLCKKRGLDVRTWGISADLSSFKVLPVPPTPVAQHAPETKKPPATEVVLPIVTTENNAQPVATEDKKQ